MRKMHAFVAVLMALLVAMPHAALAVEAPDTPVEALDTQGVPVSCGTAAVRLREGFTTDGLNAYPMFHDTVGNPVAADELAATGLKVRYGEGDETVERDSVLMGDLVGTGQFDLMQLVSFADCMTSGQWTDLQGIAGDLNGDGSDSLVDLVILAGYYRAANPQAPADPYPTPDAPSPAGKTLVAWFSGTGNTEAVAQVIARELGADTFEIEPAVPCTAADLNYSNPDSRVCKEHEDPSLRNIELTQAAVTDIEQYDTIFIGYPIWWQIAAWSVDAFVKANDFGEITVIPFCTSASSSLGSSASNLREIATGGNWLAGRRFASSVSAQTIVDWLDTPPLDRTDA